MSGATGLRQIDHLETRQEARRGPQMVGRGPQGLRQRSPRVIVGSRTQTDREKIEGSLDRRRCGAQMKMMMTCAAWDAHGPQIIPSVSQGVAGDRDRRIEERASLATRHHQERIAGSLRQQLVEALMRRLDGVDVGEDGIGPGRRAKGQDPPSRMARPRAGQGVAHAPSVRILNRLGIGNNRKKRIELVVCRQARFPDTRRLSGTECRSKRVRRRSGSAAAAPACGTSPGEPAFPP